MDTIKESDYLKTRELMFAEGVNPNVTFDPENAQILGEEQDVDEFLANLELVAKAIADAEAKMTGFDYNGVMCSATAEDQHGLTDILAGMQNNLLTETPFKFENGSVLVLTAETINEFATTWSAFRQSFFTVEE